MCCVGTLWVRFGGLGSCLRFGTAYTVRFWAWWEGFWVEACGFRGGGGGSVGANGTERQQANGKAREKTARKEKKRNGAERHDTTNGTGRTAWHEHNTARNDSPTTCIARNHGRKPLGAVAVFGAVTATSYNLTIIII